MPFNLKAIEYFIDVLVKVKLFVVLFTVKYTPKYLNYTLTCNDIALQSRGIIYIAKNLLSLKFLQHDIFNLKVHSNNAYKWCHLLCYIISE